jgi:hypothetical protein
MADWRYVRAQFLLNGTADIAAIKPMKAEHGFNYRKGDSQRPHFHLSLANVDINIVDHIDGDIGAVVGTIESDGSVTFMLPKAIAGSGTYCGGKNFKITRS